MARIFMGLRWKRHSMVITFFFAIVLLYLFNKRYLFVNHEPEAEGTHSKGIITIGLSNSLGTAMFQYAALLGIAYINDREPAIPKDHILRKYFHITAKHYQPNGLSSVEHIREENPYKYDRSMETLQSNADVIELTGLYQSWLYFEEVPNMVLEEFTFRESYQYHAEQYIDDAIKAKFGDDIIREEIVVIGVHIRRQGVCETENIKRGFAAADAAYITSTMDEVVGGLDASRYVFIICTDDNHFVDSMKFGEHKVVIASDFNEAEDLATLAACDDVIMTTGAFGWWGAYLTHGQVVYYEPFALPQSELEKQFVAHDYYIPSWDGRSGNSPIGLCGS